jgi:microcystin-dependent protein
VAWATTASGGASLPLGDLALWLKADTGVVRKGTNGSVGGWYDQSGNHNDAIQGNSIQQPGYVTNAINGLPVVRFNATNQDGFGLPQILSGTTNSEAFVVTKVSVALPGSWRALWKFGYSGVGYPNPDGTIADSFASTSVNNLGQPAQPLDQYHVYEVASSQSGLWEAWINGQLQFLTTNNSYYATPAYGPTLGFDDQRGNYFDGDMAEVLVFNRTLTDSERLTVNVYLNGKYGYIGAPTAPANLTATALTPTQISLNWSNVTATITAGTVVQIQRKTESSGTYALIATVGPGVTNYLDASLPSGHTYFYRVRAMNESGVSPYSNEASALANNAPIVMLATPNNNTPFFSGESIVISASVMDVDGTIPQVKFFSDGGNLIGEASGDPRTIVWANAPVGSHSLTAEATDNSGTATVSTPVIVTVSDQPLAVALTLPTNNAVFLAPATIPLSATASDQNGIITKVEFDAGPAKIAESANAPYLATWTNVAAGTYFITAKAMDNLGAVTVSLGITIAVNPVTSDSDPSDTVNLQVYTPLY